MIAIRLGSARLIVGSITCAALVRCDSALPILKGLLKGSVLGNDIGSYLLTMRDVVKLRGGRRSPLSHSAKTMRPELPAPRVERRILASINYLLSAVSCSAVFLSAECTAARNGSALAGAFTALESVFRKGTSLP